jgi:hypothetical protein
MPRHNRWRLATSADLTAFHATRHDIYHSAAEILLCPLGRAQLETLVRRLAAASARTPGFLGLDRWRSALVGAAAGAPIEHGAFLAPLRTAGVLDCQRPAEPAREAALRHASVGLGSNRAFELLTMSVLARRTASSFEAGQLAEAARLSLVQADFLRCHAGECLLALADALAQSDEVALSASGKALRSMVEDDLEFLATGSGI